MLSNHSFNALLKTLEEPPPHAMFLLATTDPQKLPATVLSRCLQFNLKNMQPEQIVAHLEHILTAEAVSADPEALALIGRAAEGSMRDALSLTDQAIAYGEGKLVGAEVAEMLGTVDRGQVLELVAAILDEDPAAVLALVAQIAEHAPDFVSTLDELSSILHQMTIAQTVPGALDTSWPDQARIVELAASATVDDTQLFWQMAVSGRREVHLASSARAGLEMILLRMIAFRPAAVIQSQAAVGDPPVKKPDPPAMPVGSDAEPNTKPDTTPSPSVSSALKSGAAPQGSGEQPADGPLANGHASAGLGLGQLTSEGWPTLFDRLQFTGILHNIALNLELSEVSGSALSFSLAEGEATLLNDRHPGQFTQALCQQLGQVVTATITVINHSGRTPAAHRAAAAAARLADAEHAISSDDALHGLLKAFDAEIIPGSLRPNMAEGEPTGDGAETEGRV